MKQTYKDNFRVEVEPDFWLCRTDEEKIQKCKDIQAEIKRHVDCCNSIIVQYDLISICSHCQYKWTEESPTFNGGCCEKDFENEPAEEV